MGLADEPTTPATPNVREVETPADGLGKAHARESARRALFGRAQPVKCGRFEVRGQLGAGGMGEVFEGWDPDLERRVALKVLHAERSDDASGRKRLVREAQTLARLRHPNVVAVYEVGEDSGRMFVAMELVDGTTLREWLEEAPRSQADVLAVYSLAAAGLQAAHDAGLVHRDFKPDNVMVTRQGEARVVDFGLARAGLSEQPPETLGIGPEAITQTGTLAGTPAYMSPEQMRGEKADPASDQFSFCVALFAALFGQPPFRGETFSELRGRVLAGDMSTPNASVPPHIRRALLRGLSADPEARHASMRELVAALQPKRRPWWLAAALCAVAALGIAAWPGPEEPAAPTDPLMGVCTDRDSLRATWDAWEPELDGMLVGLHATGLDDMHATGRERASRWDDARTTVCGDPGRTREQLQCLDQMRGMLEAAMDRVGAVDELAAKRATIWSQRMLDPKVCADAVPVFDTYPSGDEQERRAAWHERVVATSAVLEGMRMRWDAVETMLNRDFEDPVARITAKVERFILATHGPPTSRFVRMADRETMAALATEAEAVGAQYMVNAANLFRLSADTESLPPWKRLQLFGTVQSRMKRLNWDLSVATQLHSQALPSQDPGEADAYFAEAMHGLSSPAYNTFWTGVLGDRYTRRVLTGDYEAALGLLDEQLAQVHPLDETPVFRAAFWAETDFDDVLRRVARRREVVAEYRTSGHELPGMLNPLWLELDPLQIDRSTAKRVVADALAGESSNAAAQLAIELQDYDAAEALIARRPPTDAREFDLRLAVARGEGQTRLEDVLTSDADFNTWIDRAAILAEAGHLIRARALVESTLQFKSISYAEDLHARARAAFVLAQILVQVDLEHHGRALTLARNARSMYAFGQSDLFARHLAEVDAWLRTHEAPP